ncbi:hypothetical protein [Sphingorhabdus sp. SMR4y]|uniref:hypothetical protein n=1 Tax=Sphingorhabdus sp. SMR4y TaxID=2584094 RepID=UPI000B5C8502|nr:hypothetical protein [Sphingorhabdus sp. SMR4y]ASK87632.1 hypothetical protein SPHFLASMR4Y_00852 [Sphingorhabdus sp. SMR4y]
MPKLYSWRNFWIFWGGGLALFIYLIASNGALETLAAPNGILDHQSAATADRVNAIQQSWAESGVLDLARWAMIADLVFITLYMSGGIIGGRLIWQRAKSPALKKTGLLCVLAYFVFGLTDYIETISQLVQLVNEQGSDILAGTAALAKPVKIISWIVGTVAMIAALIWRWRETRT